MRYLGLLVTSSLLLGGCAAHDQKLRDNISTIVSDNLSLLKWAMVSNDCSRAASLIDDYIAQIQAEIKK